MKITEIKTYLMHANMAEVTGWRSRNWLFVKVFTDEGIYGVGEASGWPRVVETAIQDLADFPALNAVWEAWVPAGHAPPRATVQAQLAKPEWRVEMVVTAAL